MKLLHWLYISLNLKGSDYTMSLDGHDKLCGHQKSMFPLCIYGGQDAFSARMNFLRIWTTNNDPKVIGRFYFDYLYKSRGKEIWEDNLRNLISFVVVPSSAMFLSQYGYSMWEIRTALNCMQAEIAVTMWLCEYVTVHGHDYTIVWKCVLNFMW